MVFFSNKNFFHWVSQPVGVEEEIEDGDEKKTIGKKGNGFGNRTEMMCINNTPTTSRTEPARPTKCKEKEGAFAFTARGNAAAIKTP